jgi:hypothetical protein
VASDGVAEAGAEGAAVSPGALAPDDADGADGALDPAAGPSVGAVPGGPLHPTSTSTITRTESSLRIVDLPQSDPRDADAPEEGP